MVSPEIFGRCFSLVFNLPDTASEDCPAWSAFSMNERALFSRMIFFPRKLAFRRRSFDLTVAFFGSYPSRFLFFLSSYEMQEGALLRVKAISFCGYPFARRRNISFRSVSVRCVNFLLFFHADILRKCQFNSRRFNSNSNADSGYC